MGRAIVMFERDGVRRYCEWSTGVDAPISWLLPLSLFEEHIREKYGDEGLRRLPERIARVHECGTSALWTDRASLVEGNRAGPNESELTEAEIMERYEVGGSYWRSCEVKRE